MKYLFRDRWCDVPCYAPYRPCALVNVRFAVPLARVAPHDQRAMARSWRKVWRFVLAEGPVATWNKIRSKKEQELLTGDFHVVLAVGALVEASETAPVLCLGTRHPRCAERMLFHRELIAPLDRWPSAEELMAAVRRAVPDAQQAWLRVAGYNFYSDEPPPVEAIRLLRAVGEALAAPGNNMQATLRSPEIEALAPPSSTDRDAASASRGHASGGGVAVIAAGDYARTQIIPALRRAGARLDAIADLEPLFAAHAKERFGFARALTDWRAAIAPPETDFIVVASYHDTHAQIAAEAARLGKKVLVEKPPAVTREDLCLLLEALHDPCAFIEVGFNRRFAPFTRQARRLLDEVTGPLTILCRVKEVEIPDAHWYRWPKEGTRITGNLCHWIDLAVHFVGDRARPVEIVLSPPVVEWPDEERTLSIAFDDGSTAVIAATSRGDATLGVQERLEIRRDRMTVEIDDYRTLNVTWDGRRVVHRRARRDKGHRTMYIETFRRAQRGERALYTPHDLRWTTTLVVRATELALSGERSARLDD